MAEGVPPAVRASADGKLAGEDVVSSSDLHRAQLHPGAALPRELQAQPEYDDATVERVYRKLDLRIIPRESKHPPTTPPLVCPPQI